MWSGLPVLLLTKHRCSTQNAHLRVRVPFRRDAFVSTKKKAMQLAMHGFLDLAEWTGLEPATPGVTGRYSNQLNYHSW